ncbi:uncharacterized protein TNCV_4253991 [Trichonephila clavipes]|nr:uncharacterized protein TNCV_4253991 [Trichonephila clavipes]
MRVWKQWTDEHRKTRKTVRGRWNVTSVHDDRHLLHMSVNDRTVCSRLSGNALVYCYMCSNVSFVHSSTSTAPWTACKGVFYTGSPSWQIFDSCISNGLMSTEPCKLIATKLSFRFNLWSHDGRIRVRRCVGERCLLECVIE